MRTRSAEPATARDPGGLAPHVSRRPSHSRGCLYRLGLALLDLEDPRRVIRRSDEWIFARRRRRCHGDVNGVVFPCGWILKPSTGNIHIYYGGADTCLALATAQLSDLLDYPCDCPEPRDRRHSKLALPVER